VAVVQPDGSLHMANGHHLAAGDTVRLRHPAFGEADRTVDVVDPVSGHVVLQGAGLDPAWTRVKWRDPRLAEMRLGESLRFWRRSAHPLSLYRKVQGNRATTNAHGALVVEGHLARPGDRVLFGERTMLLDDEGRSAGSNPLPRVLIAAELPVASVTADTIRFGSTFWNEPDTGAVAAMPIGATAEAEPFRFRLHSRSGGVARLELTGLMPDLDRIPFDYHVSHLLRQPGGRKWVWAWEIDPPEGIKYAGPGSVIFSPWFILPWFFIDFDPDEQARLDRIEERGIRVA
jgi:hypothetical protein